MSKNKQILSTTGDVGGRVRNGFYIGVSLASLLALSACETPSFLRPLTGEAAPQQVVGARRAPRLNVPSPSDYGDVAPSSRRKPSAMNSANVAPEPAFSQSSPYDMYDERGNETDAKVISEENSADEGNFFTKLFSSSSAFKDAARPERKRFLGNPYSEGVKSSAPVAPVQIEESGIDNVPADSGSKSQSAEQIVKQPEPLISSASQAGSSDVNVASDSVSEEKPSFFERIAQSLKSSGESGKSSESVADAAASAPASSLAMNSDDSDFADEEEWAADKFEKIAKDKIAPEEKAVVESASVEKAAESAAPQVGFFDRIASHLKFDDSASVSADKGEKTPELSSVPPKPEEFEAVKKEQQQNLDELKTEHSAAFEEKSLLDTEVSGELPAAKKSVSLEKNNERDAVGEVKSESKTLPVLPVPAFAEGAQEEEVSYSPPAPAPASAPAPVSAPVEERPSLFDRLRNSLKSSGDAEAVKNEEKASAPVVDNMIEEDLEEGHEAASAPAPVAEPVSEPVEEKPSLFDRLKNSLKYSGDAEAVKNEEKASAPVVDKMIEEDLEEGHEAASAPESAPAPVSEPVEEKPSLFDRLRNSLKSSGDAEAVKNEEKASAPVVDKMIEEDLEEGHEAASAPAPVSEAKPLLAPIAEKQEEQKAASDIKADASVDDSSSGSESAPVSAQKVGASSLPSPEIIKTMRPSRYEARRTHSDSAY